MILQQADLSDPVTLILLIISVVLVAIVLYISARLIAGKKETDTGYIIRLLLIAIIIVLLVAVVIGTLVGAVSAIPFIATAAAHIDDPAVGARGQISPASVSQARNHELDWPRG